RGKRREQRERGAVETAIDMEALLVGRAVLPREVRGETGKDGHERSRSLRRTASAAPAARAVEDRQAGPIVAAQPRASAVVVNERPHDCVVLFRRIAVAARVVAARMPKAQGVTQLMGVQLLGRLARTSAVFKEAGQVLV